MPNLDFYTEGGTIEVSDAKLYIERQSDQELLNFCQTGKLAYVLTARQMGKSSLMVRTASKLEAENIAYAIVDLQPIGSNATRDQFYLSIIRDINYSLKLGFNFQDWWRENSVYTATDRFVTFFDQIVLSKISTGIVIFIDEIDTTLKLEYKDDFFATIRHIFNLRATRSEFKRLSFVLVGTATPNELISDPTRTPFNIGHRVDLTDFTAEEAAPFVAGFQLPLGSSQQILQWVLRWTNGHPYLTQIICSQIAHSKKTTEWSETDINRLVQATFFTRGLSANANIQFVRSCLTERVPENLRLEVIEIYSRIRRDQQVKDEINSQAKSLLKLSGVVQPRGEYLILRNPIYREVFDLVWVRQQMVGLGSQADLSKLVETSEVPNLSRTIPSLPTDTPIPEPEVGVATRNPFKGLRPFTDDDSRDFFGRDQLIGDLVEEIANRLRNDEERFMAVVGASGSGKSSVIRAGVLPVLKQGKLQGSESWAYQVIEPGLNPIENLAIGLSSWLPERTQTSIIDELQKVDDEGLDRLCGEIKRTRVVLFIDQFEEIFTLTWQEKQRQQFIDLLVKTAKSRSGNAIIIISLRADFFDRPLQFSSLAPLMQRHTHYVIPMTLTELQDAIQQPMQLADVRRNITPELVYDLANEVYNQPGSLPLLQFTLQQLFDHSLAKQERDLSYETYHQIGGVTGALKRHAEETYNSLPSDFHRLMAKALFLRLIEPGETIQETTRRRISFSTLTFADENSTKTIHEVANAFVQARLLVTNSYKVVSIDEYSETTTLEVSHEALIREWERLGKWVESARKDIQIQKAVGTVASEWRQRGNKVDDDILYRGTILEDAENWAKNNIPTTQEQAFIQASIHAQRTRLEREERTAKRAQQLRVTAVAAVVATLIAIAVAIGAVGQVSNANQQIALVEQTLTPVPRTLNAVRTLVLAANQDAETAIAQAGAAESQAAAANASATPIAIRLTKAAQDVDVALNQVDNARTQVANSNQTLTPIPLTLTVVAQQLDAGAAQVADFMQQANDANQTLTPIPLTLAVVAEQLNAGAAQIADLKQQATDANLQAQRVGTEIAITLTPLQGTSDAANLAASIAQTQAAIIQATLLPVPQTLTPVAMTLVAGNLTLQAAVAEIGDIVTQQARATQAAVLATDAAAVQPTLTAVQNALNAANSNLQAVQLRVTQAGQDAQAVSKSMELANNADAVSVAEPDLALALALEANYFPKPASSAQLRLSSLAYNSLTIRNETPFKSGWVEVAISGNYEVMVGCAEVDLDNKCLRLQLIKQYIGFDAANYNPLVVELAGVDVRDLALHPSQPIALAAICSLDKTQDCSQGDAVLIDLEKGEIIQRIQGAGLFVDTVAFSPDGKQFLTGGCDEADPNNYFCTRGTIILWDTQTRKEIKSIDTRATVVDSLLFGKDGNTFYVGQCSAMNETNKSCAKGEIVKWDITNNKALERFEGHTSWVNALVITSDEKSLFSVSGDGYAIEWDTANGQEVQRYGKYCGLLDIALKPDEKSFILACGNDIRFLDRASGNQIRIYKDHDNTVSSLTFVPHTSQVISASKNGNVIHWDATAGAYIRSFSGNPKGVWKVALSPDGQIVASASFDGTIRMWDMKTGQLLHFLAGHNDNVTSLVFSPDGKYIVSGSCAKRDDTYTYCVQGEIIFWDASSGFEHLRLIDNHSFVNSLAYSPDGKAFLAGGCSEYNATKQCVKGEILLFDASTLKVIRQFDGHSDDVNSLAFSPDGQYFISGSDDDSLILWDITTQAKRIFKANNAAVKAVAFSPKGDLVATGLDDNSIIIWDIQSGQPYQRPYRRHSGTVWDVAFSPDGSKLLSGASGTSNALILWDINSGEAITVFPASSTIYSVVFSPDGRTGLAGSSDHSVISWKIDQNVSELINWTLANRSVRTLTCTERLQFKAEPYCDNNIAMVSTPYPTLTALPTPDFAIASATPTASLTPIYPTFTPSPTFSAPTQAEILNSEYTLSNGIIAERVDKRIIDLTGHDNYRNFSDLRETYSDFAIGTTISWETDATTDICGVRFHASDSSNFYTIAIDRVGQLWFKYLKSNSWQVSRKGDVSGIKEEKNQSNDLVIIAANNTYSVYINGLYINQFTDKSIVSGSIGLYAETTTNSDESKCEFTNTWLWKPNIALTPIASPAPTGTVAPSEAQAKMLESVGVSPISGLIATQIPKADVTIDSGSGRLNWDTIDGANYKNFVLQATIDSSSFVTDNYCGFVFNYTNVNDSNSYYVIGVNRDNYVRILKKRPEVGYYDIISTRLITEVKPLSDNELTLVSVNNSYQLYVNGSLVSQWTDRDYEFGTILVATIQSHISGTCTMENILIWNMIFPLPEDQLNASIVTGSGAAKLRFGPNTQFDVIDTLDNRRRVRVIAQNSDGSWLQIITPEGRQGWISAALVKRDT